MIKSFVVLAMAVAASASVAEKYASFVSTTAPPPAAPIQAVTLGAPYYGTVNAGSYKYYSVVVPMNNDPTIDIELGVLRGDPDLFVSTSNMRYPGWTTYDYDSVGFSDEQIVIAPHDSHNSCPDTGSCTIYMAVYGFSNATYVLWPSAQDTVVQLYNGFPYFRNAPGSLTALQPFEFYAGDAGEPVVFQATVTDPGASEWELSMYVSTANFSQGPSPSKYQWASIGDNGYHYTNVVILPSDPYFCAGCTYYVSVQAPTHHTAGINYTLVATNGLSYINLIPELKQMGHVEQAKTQYYYITVFTRGAAWTAITVTPESDNTGGDPDLYVLAGKPPLGNPSPSAFMWKSLGIGGDQVNITASDPQWISACGLGCELHIAVVGFQSSTYSVIVQQSGRQAPPTTRA